MSVPRIEFFYDLSSPWTYLAFSNISAMEERLSVGIILRPILVGGVFNAVNPAIYAARDDFNRPDRRHQQKVLRNWAALAEVEMKFPSEHHPLKSINAMRFACALAENPKALNLFTLAAFQAYFGDQMNIDDPQVLVRVAGSIGLDGAKILSLAQTDPVKALLRANTDELIARGGFGSPTIFVDGHDMYFGNDQLPLVEAALTRTPPL